MAKSIIVRVSMKAPLVSIITPAYNCVSTIEETYKSILSQTFSDWEWIIVEDHSKDDSYNFIKKIIKDDTRVTLLQTEKNSGAAIARNAGIEKARGRFIAFLDADDLWKKEKLEHQVEFMLKNNYSFTFTNYDVLFPNGKIVNYEIKKNQLTYKNLLRTNAIGCLTVIYDSEQLGKVFMPVDCYKREDYGAWLDITRNGTLAYKLNESLSIYRLDSNSVSSNKFRLLKYQYNVYRKHEKFNFIKSFWLLLICSLNKFAKKY